MSIQEITTSWFNPEGQRPWPPESLILQSLRELDEPLIDMRFRPLGARTAEVICVKKYSENHICIVRQRSPDPRMVCPLEEEYFVLQQMHSLCPTLVPEPIGVIRPNYSETFLVLRWVDGLRLGSRLQVSESAEEIAEAIFPALSMFHTVGKRCDHFRLTRQIRVDRLFDDAERSPLRGNVVQSEIWDRTISILREMTRGFDTPTLLHGDAHAYNLIETTDGSCWVDFELLAVGPPEIDNARTWVLLQAQAQREVISPWQSEAQLAYDFLAATNFLAAPSKEAWKQKGWQTVRSALIKIVSRL